ncbi:MAG: hypothetical protein RIA38_05195, partial [Microcella pacifica]
MLDSTQEQGDVANPSPDIHALLEPLVRDVVKQGLTVVIGSGWSTGKGLPSMGELAAGVVSEVESQSSFGELSDSDHSIWAEVKSALAEGLDFESALDAIRTDGPVLLLVELAIANLLRPREASAITSSMSGHEGFDDLTRLFNLLSGTGDA